MGTNTFIGLLIVILGGVMEGAFSLPVRLTEKRWQWENIWAAGSLAALLLVPWPLAFATVPQLGTVFASVSWQTLLVTILFGCGWGAGSIFFGRGIAALGISVGLSLIMALIAIGGSLLPLLMQHPEQLGQPAGLLMLAGIAVMIAGILICARAGHLKQQTKAKSEQGKGSSAVAGFVFCLLAGLLSPMVNFALIFGGGIAETAARFGASPGNANNAIWALVFTANFAVNILYCLWLMRQRGTLANYRAPGTAAYWIAALAMGLLWAGGIVVYGAGATRMGPFGAYLGFPVMLICSILTGNVLGVFAGEWNGVAVAPKRVMVAGIAVLLLAISLLGYANALVV